MDYRALFSAFALVSPSGILHAYLVFLFLPPIVGWESYVVALITTPKFVPSGFTVYYSLGPFPCQRCVPAYLSFPRVSFCKIADFFCFFYLLRSYQAFALQVIEVWERVVKHSIFDPFLRIFWMDFVPS